MQKFIRKKFNFKFFLIFMMLFSLFSHNLFADDSSDDSGDSDDDGGWSWSETDYCGEDGWDGTENTSNSPNDDTDGWGGASYDWGNDGGSDSDESDENLAWNGEEFLSYDDVYDENGNPIYHDESQEIEDMILEYFYEEMLSRQGIDGDVLAGHYREAELALEVAKSSGVAEDIEKAQAELDSAKEALDRYCEHYEYTWESSGDLVHILDKAGNNVGKAGDPVFVSTGKFVIDDSDISISNGKTSFSLERHYVSNGTDFYMQGNENKDYLERTSGAFGPLWASNFDSRIIRAHNSSFVEILPKLESYAEKLSNTEAVIADYASEDSECEPILEEIQQIIAENDEKIAFYENESSKSEAAKKFNRFVGYGKAGSFNGNLPANLLIYCGDDGGMIVFENSDSENSVGLYLPVSNVWKNKITLEKLSDDFESSGETQTEVFCVAFVNSGEKRFYSSYGLPMRFEYENENSIRFKYDNDFHISKILLDENHYLDFAWNGNLLASVFDGERKVSYGYEGENLVSTTDFENDTRRFEYDSDGFLKKQIKADGSFISFEYEENGGEKFVSSVTNEEGKSEHFSYDLEERKTIYTNHDGEEEIYFYDEKNQTTKIHHSDGSEENWNYDENGNVVSWNNGNVFANYKYNDAGRFTEKNDEAGASESFSYSDNKIVSHKNKYGLLEDYSYDDEGNISEIYVGGELLKSFSYENGLLHKETDCRGNSFLYFYDEKSNLSQIKLLESGSSSPFVIASFEYDGQNRVKKSLGADGITRNFIYGDHKITENCSNSVRITKTYSSRKLLLSEEFEDETTGEIFRREYEYDKTGKCRKIYVSGKDSSGNQTEKILLYEYDFTSAGKISREMKWNFSSVQKSQKNQKGQGRGKSGTETFYSYDSAGNLCEIKKRKIGGLSENEKVTRLESERTERGNLVAEIFGSAEKTFEFDLRGNLLEEKIGGTSVFSENYSASGMLLSENFGAYGGRTYSYGEDGFLSSVAENDSVKTDSSEVSYFPDGKIRQCADTSGNKIFYEYNGSGMLTRVSSSFKTTEYEYDLCGKLISKRIKNAENRVIYEESWVYDDFGRKVFHKIGGKNVEKLVKNGFGVLKSKSDSVENSWIYSTDILGRKVSERNPYGKITEYLWDENNLLEKITFPDGSFEKFSYDLDLNLLKVEDNAGILKEYEYDGFNRLVSAWNRPSSAPEKYEYDDFGRITKVSKAGKILLSNSYDDSKKRTARKDANGNVSFWNFDGAGRLLSSQNRLGAFSKNEWNPDGRIKSSTDFTGAEASYFYDKFGLKNAVSYSSGENSSFEFDVAGNLFSVKNENSVSTFEYDNAGNLISQKDSAADSDVQFEYEDGKIAKITCGSRKIFYEYGKCGEILKITDQPGTENSGQTTEITFEYDSCGREISRKWKSGESMQIFYDKAGREILRAGFSSSHGIVFAEGAVYDEKGFKTLVLESDFTVKRYEYDELGRVKSVSYPFSDEKAEYLKSCIENAGLYSLEGSEDFCYESLSASEYNELKNLCDLLGVSLLSSGMKKSIKESFEYDLNSNLVKRTTPYGAISYVYDKNDRLVSWGNGCSAEYDANGNMTLLKSMKKQVQMEYNALNRLKKIEITDFSSDEKISSSYEYDAFGRRIKSVCAEKGTTKTFYIGASRTELCSVFTPSASVSSDSTEKTRSGKMKMEDGSKIRYKFFDDVAILADSDSGTEYFTSKSAPLFSQNGELLNLSSENDDASGERISFMTGKTGTVKSFVDADDLLFLLEYDEFGFPLSQGLESSYGFGGKKFDSKTELYDFGYRDYAPNFGRFSTEDPVLDGWNWYAYCMGDYVNFFDPDGLTQVVPEEQHMQDMGEVLLGNSKSETTDKQGCLVTAIAETVSALTGHTVDPSFINNDKSNFAENSGLISWAGIFENYGLEHTVFDVSTDRKEVDILFENMDISNIAKTAGNIIHLGGNDLKSNTISEYINNIMESSKDIVVVLQVAYDLGTNPLAFDDSLHFVVANGNVTMIDGKSYVSITPTSINDRSVGKDSLRGNAGWIERDGKIYVPVENIQRVDTLSKNK